jgi:hypothetical protein
MPHRAGVDVELEVIHEMPPLWVEDWDDHKTAFLTLSKVPDIQYPGHSVMEIVIVGSDLMSHSLTVF